MMEPSKAVAGSTARPIPAPRSGGSPRPGGFLRSLMIADRYLYSQVAGAFFRGLGWFAGLFLAFALISTARRTVSDDIPLWTAMQFIALQAPRIIQFTIPASLLYGTVQTFTEMSSKGEITALFAGGMSLRRMLRAPLAFAVALTLLTFLLQEVLVPGAELRKSQLLVDAIESSGKRVGFKVVDPPGDGAIKRVVQAREFDPKARVFENPVVQIFKPDGTIEFQIQAQRARWSESDGAWYFEKGEVNVRNDAAVSGGGTYDSRNRFNQMRIETDVLPQPKKLYDSSSAMRKQLEQKNYEMVSWRDLFRYRRELRREHLQDTQSSAARRAMNSATYGIHDKVATPLACIALVLLGAPLGIRPQRTASPGLAMGLSLAAVLGYYMLRTFAEQWGKGGVAFPVFSAYMPLLVMAVAGIVLIRRKS